MCLAKVASLYCLLDSIIVGLTGNSNILNRDHAIGSLNSGGLYEIAGISIKRSNNLPFMLDGTSSGSVAQVSGENNDYSGDFRTHAGLIYQKDAAGVLTAIGPQVQTTGNDIRAMYQVIWSSAAWPWALLNPAAAIELRGCLMGR